LSALVLSRLEVLALLDLDFLVLFNIDGLLGISGGGKTKFGAENDTNDVNNIRVPASFIIYL
jgi:hypothetical protein